MDAVNSITPSVGYLVGHIRVLQERVHAQHRVVRLDARRRDLRARPNREGDLRLLAVVDGEALEEQAAETGAGAAAAGIENPRVTFFDFSIGLLHFANVPFVY